VRQQVILKRNNSEQLLLLLLAVLQIVFSFAIKDIKPAMTIVPEVPNVRIVKIFGDDEFYFRYKGLVIQNSGDSFGRFSPLKDYDYAKLYKWFRLLDEVNNKSNYIPSLAAYYYSMTQNTQDVIHIINYLTEHADQNPNDKWWWYYQAIFLADNVYGDKNLAINIAKKMKELSPDTALLWTKQMLPILLAKNGNESEALQIITSILHDHENKNIGDDEIDYMKFFIKKMLKKRERKK